MLGDTICVLHTQIPRELRTEPSDLRFRKMLLGLGSVSGGNRVLSLGSFAGLANNSNCLHCIIPSKEISINDCRYSSFSHPRTEKSDSTVPVFGNIVAIPPQKSLRISNFLVSSL